MRIAHHLLDLGSQVASEDGRHGRWLALPRTPRRAMAPWMRMVFANRPTDGRTKADDFGL
ncbi:hypothetical protein OH687_04315 [Burkholderia anthina]|nr:hypothetical protein OH687_04315 [Burkholderia anthina]